MPESANTLRDEATRVLRELAGKQGVAYCAYGEALGRFGNHQIGLTELLKTSGDIYFREAGHVAASLFEVSADVYRRMLSAVGTKIVKPDVESAEPAHTRNAAKG